MMTALIYIMALEKQTLILPKEYLGMRSALNNILPLKKKTLILPKGYWDKQDFIEKPPLGVMSVLTTINEEMEEETN